MINPIRGDAKVCLKEYEAVREREGAVFPPVIERRGEERIHFRLEMRALLLSSFFHTPLRIVWKCRELRRNLSGSCGVSVQ